MFLRYFLIENGVGRPHVNFVTHVIFTISVNYLNQWNRKIYLNFERLKCSLMFILNVLKLNILQRHFATNPFYNKSYPHFVVAFVEFCNKVTVACFNKICLILLKSGIINKTWNHNHYRFPEIDLLASDTLFMLITFLLILRSKHEVWISVTLPRGRPQNSLEPSLDLWVLSTKLSQKRFDLKWLWFKISNNYDFTNFDFWVVLCGVPWVQNFI